MRLFAGIGAIFIVGLSAGWWLSRAEATSRPAAVAATSETAEMVKLRAQLKQIVDERAALAERNAALEKEASAMHREESDLEKSLHEAVAFSDELPADKDDAAAQGQAGQNRRGNNRRGNGQQPTPEQMAEYRKNFEDQMQKRWDDALAKMNDPAAAQRLEDLMKWRDFQNDLARQMRDAKTDEDRQKLQDQMRDARQSSRSILKDQQNSILSSVAAANGITDPNAQANFVKAMNDALDNPFFQMAPMFGGGGPGGPGGFPGFGGRGGQRAGGGGFRGGPGAAGAPAPRAN